MPNKTKSTEQEDKVTDQYRINQETELIKREFPYEYPKRLKDREDPLFPSFWHNREDMVKKISQNCADISRCMGSIENSISEAYGQLGIAAAKVLVNGALAAITAYALHKGTGVLFAGVPTLYLTYRNLFGKHVMNGYGHYLEEPYFRVIDNLRFAYSWSKIAKLQKEGKLSHGTEEFSTDDCYRVLGRNFIGGP